MWLVTVHGFVSLVVDRKDRNMLQVRARVANDIIENFPGAKVYIANGGDYRYRARVRKAEVAIALAEQIMDMDYDSHFKDVALARSKGSTARRSAYYGTWSAMARMQDYAPYSKMSRAEVAKLPKFVPAAATGVKGITNGLGAFPGGIHPAGGFNYKKRDNGVGYEPVNDGFSAYYDDYDYDRWGQWDLPETSNVDDIEEKIREDLFTGSGVEPTDAELRQIERQFGADFRTMDDDTRDEIISLLREEKREMEAMTRNQESDHGRKGKSKTGGRVVRNQRNRNRRRR